MGASSCRSSTRCAMLRCMLEPLRMLQKARRPSATRRAARRSERWREQKRRCAETWCDSGALGRWGAHLAWWVCDHASPSGTGCERDGQGGRERR
eukprot:scaffold304328_cov32-Tisochrysis_lutea.AAC.2